MTQSDRWMAASIAVTALLMLVAFDAIFLALSVILFDFVVEE